MISSRTINKKAVFENLFFLLLTIGMSLFFRFFILYISVPSESMEKTVMTGDRMLVYKTHKNTRGFSRGDILVFSSIEDPVTPGVEKLFLKRLIGLPGDFVEIRDDTVYINGEKLTEPYVVRGKAQHFSGEFTVPADSYFFLGDNRSRSHDSRYWKNPYVLKSKIIGKAGLRIVPFKKFGFIK